MFIAFYIVIWVHSFCHIDHMASSPPVLFVCLFNKTCRSTIRESYIMEASSSRGRKVLDTRKGGYSVLTF